MIAPRLAAAVALALLSLASPMLRAADLDIAFIGTLTGAKATIAQDQLDGFRLAVRHLGGRLGGVEFALTVADDHGVPQQTLDAAESVWPSNRPKIILLSSGAESADRLAALGAAHHSLILNLGLASAALAGHDCNASFFSLVPRPETLQDMAGLYLQSRGYQRLAVITPDRREAALAALRHSFKGEVREIKIRPGRMDFSADLKELKQSNADAVYLLQSGGMAVEFLLQYAQSGLKQQLPLTAAADVFDETVLAASAPAPLDLISVGDWAEDLDMPANHRLIADFEPDYGRPVSARAAVGYDAAMLLDAALRAIDRRTIDIDTLRIALKRVDFPSTRGTVRFDNDQFPVLTFWVRQVAADQRGRMLNEQRGLLQKDVRDALARDCPLPAAPPLPPVKPH